MRDNPGTVRGWRVAGRAYTRFTLTARTLTARRGYSPCKTTVPAGTWEGTA